MIYACMQAKSVSTERKKEPETLDNFGEENKQKFKLESHGTSGNVL